MIEALQPTEIANVDHTTDTGRQFNKHAIRRNVLHQTFVLASFGELNLNGAPWIFTKLLNRQTHLAIVFVESDDLGFIFVSEFEKFFGIDWRIWPRDLANVYQTFHAGKNFEESAVVFNVDHPAFYNFTFFDVFGENVPWVRG